MTWPGFVTEPCTDCAHVGHNHQPRCMTIVKRRGRDEHCSCPAYHADTTQQPGLFAQEVTP